uniref:Dirigent protein n=1 Tax=Oryza rufipogon TaxID=4529 RepID=A0A0E0Q6Z0_ORYRU
MEGNEVTLSSLLSCFLLTAAVFLHRNGASTTTHLHFYMHDAYTGLAPTTMRVFGDIVALNNALTEGPSYTFDSNQNSGSFELVKPPETSLLTLDWPQGPSAAERAIAAHGGDGGTSSSASSSKSDGDGGGVSGAAAERATATARVAAAMEQAASATAAMAAERVTAVRGGRGRRRSERRKRERG